MATVTEVAVKNCEGGHYCSPPKECCKQGCCYIIAPAVSYRPPSLPTSSVLNPIFIGHWYFWAALMVTIAGILCACSLWRKHSQSSLICCKNSGRDDRVSEPDSNGSCYAPPQYSRCNSFYQAPPPYSEVTSKPDMYPLVISYNGISNDQNHKWGGTTGYLMVQYFRNYIVRPVGSLSATSTMDSLGSSFIHSVNEANTIIPPPYSCTGSLEEVHVDGTNSAGGASFPRSISSVTCSEHQSGSHRSPSVRSQISTQNMATSANSSNVVMSSARIPLSSSAHSTLTTKYNFVVNQKSANNTSERNNSSSTCSVCNSNSFVNTNVINNSNNATSQQPSSSSTCAPSPQKSLALDNAETFSRNKPDVCDGNSPPARAFNRTLLCNGFSVESESHDDDHNFTDLLNLSVCVPSSITHLPLAILTSCHQQHDINVVNSITSSDVSSLANLGTPDSPPRATSPTGELRDILDKIQQLPQQSSPLPQGQITNEQKMRSYFHRSKAKTMYMPLNESYGGEKRHVMFGKGPKNWMSISAPTTPCSNFIPSFPSQKKGSGSQKGSRSKVHDESPLLNENDESDDENKRT